MIKPLQKQLKIFFVLVFLCPALLLPACGGAAAAAEAATAAAAEPTVSVPVESLQSLDTQDFFSARDMDPSYDAAAVSIRLTGSTALCSSDSVSVSGGQITLLKEGVYLLSGTLEEGQILVDAGDSAKVQIVLNGAEITSSSSAAIYSKEADKLFLTLAEGTENRLANGGSFVPVDDSNIDAVIFSKADLTLNGEGSLTVDSPAGHGIVSKDELTITGGSYTLTAARQGFAGKDSVAIAGGNFTITAGTTGILAKNDGDSDPASLYIAGGSFVIQAQQDGIHAGGTLQIDSGSFTLVTGGGSESAVMKTGDSMFRSGFDRFSGSGSSSDATENTASCKGIKAGGALTVNGGSFDLDTADDGLHSGADLTVTGGEFAIRTGDDAIHSDAALLIRTGSFTIPYCYEGLEGLSVTIDGGSLDITARDDGINAAGGTDGSGTAQGFGPQDPFAVSEDCSVTINGGSITIVSDGDCIDSNGSLTVNGGNLKLICNGNGNTAIDVNGSFSNNGGSISTNDGSESATGKQGGRGGMGGGKGSMGGERPTGGQKGGGRMMPEPGQQMPEDSQRRPEAASPELEAGATV